MRAVAGPAKGHRVIKDRDPFKGTGPAGLIIYLMKKNVGTGGKKLGRAPFGFQGRHAPNIPYMRIV
ncbi:MAG: hypothetical protein CMN55_15135 [Sneathiella sp.]|jgi:hypothetical protein|nr:hypothetical protein [Sneathiella sp.]